MPATRRRVIRRYLPVRRGFLYQIELASKFVLHVKIWIVVAGRLGGTLGCCRDSAQPVSTDAKLLLVKAAREFVLVRLRAH